MFLQEKRGVKAHGSTTTTTSEISSHLNSIWTFRRTTRGQGGAVCLAHCDKAEGMVLAALLQKLIE
jgi:hypothetical protein